jgi:hypothetical protein
MAHTTQQPRAPLPSRNADAVDIEHLANGGIVIRRDYPDERRQRDAKLVLIVCTVLSLVPVVMFALYRARRVGEFVMIVSVVLPAGIVYRMLRQFSAATRSCVLRADRTGLTVEIATWRKATTQHFTRPQITDILLDCSGGNDPRHTLFRTFLIIRSTLARDIRCLHNVSGEELARAANALRAALGLPPRSWP